MMDGHPVRTYSYGVYKFHEDIDIEDRMASQHLEEQTDPDYMGVILFEAPDRLFTYRAAVKSLSGDEVEELIEKITYYREAPAMLTFFSNFNFKFMCMVASANIG
jgi:hypothetical protein